MKRSNALAVFLALTILGFPAAAEEKKPPQDKPAIEVRNLTIHPAPAPRPALKYHLLPTYLEQTPGNAATLYLKSFLLLQDHSRAESLKLLEDQSFLPASSPPDKTTREQITKALGDLKDVLHVLELASRRERCEWAQPTRDEPNVYEILLPDLMLARASARILRAKLRLQISERKPDEAISTLRVGFALARDVGVQEFLVSDLVSLTIQTMMSESLEGLIASPGAPNLYWALTDLPDPLISFRRALMVEGASIYLAFPKLREVKTAQWSPQQWQDVLAQTLSKIAVLAANSGDKKTSSPPDVTSLLEKAYPIARKDLLARGWKEKEVDAMCQAQAVLVETVEVFDDSRDNVFKWFSVPYWQAREGMRAADQRLKDIKSIDVTGLPSLFLPAVGVCRTGLARCERSIATLRTIEAIRLYAADHGGKLPESLDRITEVPIPLNPVTGKPFPYKLEGTTAVLDADGPPPPSPRQYRLTLSK